MCIIYNSCSSIFVLSLMSRLFSGPVFTEWFCQSFATFLTCGRVPVTLIENQHYQRYYWNLNEAYTKAVDRRNVQIGSCPEKVTRDLAP